MTLPSGRRRKTSFLYSHSLLVTRHLLVTEKMDAQTAKKEGNRLFTSGNHKDAIIKYTEAIDLDPTDVTFFSNRSAACGTVSRACSHNVNSK